MIDSLLNLVKQWTPAKMAEYAQNLPLPDLPERSRFIQEKVFNGLAIYSNESLRYIGDDGVFVSITKTTDDTCYNTLCKLYENKKLRTVIPVSRSHIDGYEIVVTRNEFDDPGIPFFGEMFSENFDENYWFEYINCVKTLIDVIGECGLKYPDTFINPHKFIRDKLGLCFNPYIFSLDRVEFTCDISTFMQNQHQQLGYLVFAYPEAIHTPAVQNMNWSIVRQKAIELWPR